MAVRRRVRGALRVYPREMASGRSWWWCNVPGVGRRALDLACDETPREEAHRVACERYAAGGLAAGGSGAAPEETLSAIILCFKAECSGRYKPRTWHSMLVRLVAMQEWFAGERVVRPSQITDEHVARWIATRQKPTKKRGGASNATINRAFLAMRVMLRWAAARDTPLCGSSPFESMRKLKEIDRQPHPIIPSPEEWRRLVAVMLSAPLPEPPTRKDGKVYVPSSTTLERHAENTRGAALLVASAVETGMRFDELRMQRDPDIRAAGVMIAAHDGWSPKSWAERTVPISKETADTLRAMVAWRDEARGLNGRALALGEHWVNDRIDEAWKRGGFVGEPPRMHDARRTFATAHVRAGVGLDRVRQLLGHRDVQTTERYLGRYRTDAEVPVSTLGVASVLQVVAPAQVIPLHAHR